MFLDFNLSKALLINGLCAFLLNFYGFFGFSQLHLILRDLYCDKNAHFKIFEKIGNALDKF